MDFLQQNFWSLLILGMLCSSLIIVLIFIIINRCIRKDLTVSQYKTKSSPKSVSTMEFYAKSSLYHPDNLESEPPPLPDRKLSDSDCNSYEDIESLPEYVLPETPPLPSAPHTDKCDDKSLDRLSISTEPYDDVVVPNCESEDYDDVG